MSLRHLRAFVAVADHGSASKAAAALFRAQSAITRSVQELESELGVTLFERRAQGMLPTAFGTALLRRARRAMAELKGAREDLARLAGSSDRVGSAPVFSMLVNEQRLQTFIALIELHHMPTVAKRLGITQPAVSAAVRELEDSLGLPLFDRTPRGMLPSAQGDALAIRVKRALAELRYAEAEIAGLRGVTEGLVTIGALPLGRTLILPRAIARTVAAHPGLRMATVEGPFDTLATALRSGDIDFILGALRPSSYATDLAGEALLRDELVVVVRAGHPLRARRKLALKDVASAPWVLPRQGVPNRDLLDAAFRARGLPRPLAQVETSDLAVLRGLLLEGDLVTAISPRQLPHELQAGVLAQLPIALPETLREIGITTRKDNQPSPGAALLVAAIRKICAELAPASAVAAPRRPSRKR